MTTRPTRARLIALAATAALLLLSPTAVAAHAELVETTPADGATVEGTPDELVAVFNEALEADGSSLSIRNAAGDRLAVGQVDPDDATRLLIADVPELAPGTYEMRWTASSDDGHLERDTWSFTVAAAEPTPSPTPEPTASPSESAVPSASASAAPSPTAEPSTEATASPSSVVTPPDDPASSSSDVVLPIVAGLAIVIVAAGLLLNRRGRPSGPA
jgi:hypothetical protein